MSLEADGLKCRHINETRRGNVITESLDLEPSLRTNETKRGL